MSKKDSIGTHKTSVYTDDTGNLCVRYHQTVVAKHGPDGKVTLNSGGWRTRTTALRMCPALRQWGTGYYVYQRKFEWFVGWHDGQGNHKRICEFYDGVTLQ